MSKRRSQSQTYIPFDDGDTPTYQPFNNKSSNRSNESFAHKSHRHESSTTCMNPFREPQPVMQQGPSGHHSSAFFPIKREDLYGQTNPYGSSESPHMSTVSFDVLPSTPTLSANLLLGSSAGHSSSDHSFEPEASGSKWNLLDQHVFYDIEDEPDALHDPNAKDEAGIWNCSLLSLRGWLNVIGMLLIVAALVGLFAGYPLFSYFAELARANQARSQYGWNVGGTNSSGQVPEINGFPSLVDVDTPDDVKQIRGFDGHEYTLVFSDEFNTDGRTFFEGDDPFWEAQDFHYWATNDVEWYDPDAITTADGNLVITMTQEPIHGMNFRSGMLQSWNKFCFTGGIIEISASLPGSPEISGLWPGAWTMGNLGRAGFGATTDGMWPYSYDSCDIGTRPNQTYEDQSGPEAALTSGEEPDGLLSFLPGQRTSACTCKGEDHPGPKHSKGRASPEIDIIEAEIKYNETTNSFRGAVSQSAQFAPFNAGYHWNQEEPASILHTTDCVFNEYEGGVFQQAASGQAYTDSRAYELTEGLFSVYGFEWQPGTYKDAHVTWITNGTRTWTMTPDSVGPDAESEISERLISYEPHYVIVRPDFVESKMGTRSLPRIQLNLGMSPGFQPVRYEALTFPAKYLIDYVRVYQRKDQINVGCSPKDMPTEDYINDHINAYSNPNLTLWADAGYSYPKSSMDANGC